MDKITKALQRLTQKEQKIVKGILFRLEKGELEGMDFKKLKGQSSIFRVRKGDIRIIFVKSGSSISILTIERRSEKTYRDF